MGFFRKPDGTTVEIPDEQAGAAVDAGFTPIAHGEHLASLEERAAEPDGGGLLGGINAGVTSALSGATLGLSDVAIGALATPAEREALRQQREAHPIVSGVANVAGAVLPALASGGASLPESGVQSIARLSPSAIVSRAAARIAAGGADAGLAVRAAASASGGGFEGAAQMAGSYLSDVALGNRDLSAEGFVGSLQSGALLGGSIGGGATFAEAGLSKAFGAAKKLIGKGGEEAATVANDFGTGLDGNLALTDEDTAAAKALEIEPGGKGWTPARSLFPKHEVTAEATKAAESQFHGELDQMVKDSDIIEKTARQKLEELRLQKMQGDLATRQHLDQLRIEQAEARVAAQKEVHATRAAQREAAELRLAKQKGNAPAAPESAAGDAPAAGAGETGGIPDTADDIHVEGATTTVRARDLDQRGVSMPEGTGEDAVKMEKARQAIREGQREPIKINVSPGGKLDIEDGRHRFAAAIEQDAPIKVSWRRGNAALDEAPVPTGEPMTDLERRLAATKQRLDEGAELGQLSGSDRDLHAADDRVLAATEPGINQRVDDFIAGGDANFRRVRDATENLAAARSRLDDWLEKYGGKQGNVGRFERSQAARDYAEGMRPKESGYYTRGPAGEDRSNILVQRGYQKEFRGTAAEREAADMKIIGNYAGGRTLEQHIAEGNIGAPKAPSFERMGRPVSEATPEEIADISALQTEERRRAAADLRSRAAKQPESGLRALDPAAMRENVVDAAARAAVDVGQVTPAQLTQKIAEHATDDIAEAIDVIGGYERAVHDAMQVVKPEVPVPAAERSAAGMADAIGRQEAAHTTQLTEAAEHTAEAVGNPRVRAAIDDARGSITNEPHWQDEMLPNGAPAPTSAPSRAGKLVQQAKDLGTVLEVLKAMGVSGVPDPSSIPVIGPLLGLYLKARAAATVWRRLGGKVPTTVETKIAARAATMRTKAVAAVERAIEGGAKVSRTAAAPAATQILKRRLLDDRDDEDQPKGARASSVMERRLAELSHYVTNRGAYLAQLKRTLPTKNPDVAQAVADVFDRRMSYLEGKAPKDPRAPSLVKSPWITPPGQLESFARTVRAVEDPSSVFDDIEHGRCTPEAADALREVYPNMFAEAQKALVTKAPELIESLSYAKRQVLSALFRVPLDATQTPEYLSWISTPSGANSAPGTSQPGTQPAPGSPPQPGIVADVSLSRMVDPSAPRRAQR